MFAFDSERYFLLLLYSFFLFLFFFLLNPQKMFLCFACDLSITSKRLKIVEIIPGFLNFWWLFHIYHFLNISVMLEPFLYSIVLGDFDLGKSTATTTTKNYGTTQREKQWSGRRKKSIKLDVNSHGMWMFHFQFHFKVLFCILNLCRVYFCYLFDREQRIERNNVKYTEKYKYNAYFNINNKSKWKVTTIRIAHRMDE